MVSFLENATAEQHSLKKNPTKISMRLTEDGDDSTNTSKASIELIECHLSWTTIW